MTRKRKKVIELCKVPTVAELNADYVADSDEEVVTQEGDPTTQRKSDPHYDHVTFIPRSLEYLPKDVTQASWNIDFTAAKQCYADRRYGDVVPTERPGLDIASFDQADVMLSSRFDFDIMIT
ncbi:hypothetical protein SNOG_12538 [Parastagonospora nodorum SN15]|uniref:Uncharacterized protein n=1 Tax=Phaeosphaeria nodorum (strain SN15 / ATCC MYA-4574 / FGSC 10173) TaxID=321614 RepID=Q0U6S6_PHANO|nr:hypothetical protein SNOG_12538 [Parastagonospora nodorum SN15]EAT79836.1 hypothetical protein SNOG_12538 [Parastagonospora nodorum SN15]